MKIYHWEEIFNVPYSFGLLNSMKSTACSHACDVSMTEFFLKKAVRELVSSIVSVLNIMLSPLMCELLSFAYNVQCPMPNAQLIQHTHLLIPTSITYHSCIDN
jgi:hypothetical protein